MSNAQTPKTTELLLNRVKKAGSDGLPLARVPLVAKPDMERLLDSGAIRLIERERYGRSTKRLVVS